MKPYFVIFGTYCLLGAVLPQALSQSHGLLDLPFLNNNQFRRQLSGQQHILTDVQQHHTHQQRQAPAQQFYSQQFPGSDAYAQQKIQPQQQQQQQGTSIRFPAAVPARNNFANSGTGSNNNIQQNQQFQRSPQNQLRSQQQQSTQQQPNINQYPPQPQTQKLQQQPSNLDLHTQNFLTLRNFANQQIGPQQSLPQRSYNNKPFQEQPVKQQPQQQPQQQQQHYQQQQQQHKQQQEQYSTLGNTVFQSQLQQHTPSQQHKSLPQQQTQQKPPHQLPVPSFQTAVQRPFSTAPQLSFQQHQQPPPPLQQQLTNQVTPNLGLPVPQIFPHLQSQPSVFPTQQQPSFTQPHLLNTHSNQQHPYPHQHLQQQSADLEYKQKLIQQHEQFRQKQYEKSQSKVKQQHEEFLAKQHSIKQHVVPTLLSLQPSSHQFSGPPRPASRPVSPSELHLFSSALQNYQKEHPTTTTTTTTTTTEASSTLRTNKDIFTQAKTDLSKFGTKTTGKKPVKTIGRDELLKQLKAALAEGPQKDEMQVVLPNGQRVQVIRTTDPSAVDGQQISQEQLANLIAKQSKDGNIGKLTLSDVAPESSKDLVLPNGSKVQILRSPNPEEVIDPQGLPAGFDPSSLYSGSIAGISSGLSNIASSAVIQSDSDEPPSLEELAKRGLIPDGYEIDGISSSKSQPTPTAPPKKKATYVYLEEQADGSFKIQGVKANGERETKQTGAEVENILERIQNGDIKLPPSVNRLTLPNNEVVEISNGVIKTTKAPPTTTSAPFITTPQRQYQSRTTPTIAPLINRSSTTIANEVSVMPTPTAGVTYGTSTHLPITERLTNAADSSQYTDTAVQGTEHADKPVTASTSSNPSEDLIQILKTNGLFAMAKYLRQSGLDSILNETGPYTIFVPTDKAFKNLLVQLGGPERAEEKFKANPRLLSGLLLHHVIPGAFEIATLQDEMTGVSLAGTQLRVNQYTMHDQEWNDVTLTTINGAMVVLNKKDIQIPQGIAHAVDRVMFPLPVGDLLQTLQSDRENRFSNFLKILYTSGLSEKLQSKGIKTYTVFAPVDKSFRDLESDLQEKLFSDKEAAEEFAMKHIVSGTLFSAGMRFYQVKDSLLTGKTVILQKTSAGKIKVNDAQMVTSNIPATNGVIHALDGVLT